MKIIFRILSVLTVLVCGIQLFAQEIQTDKPQNKCRLMRETDDYSAEKFNHRSAGIRLCLIGDSTSVVPAKNASFRVLKDLLEMKLGYSAPQSITPESVHFEIRSFSPELNKYRNNRKLIVSVEGQPILSEEMELRSSIEVAEILILRIKYEDFLKFTAAKKVKIQLGETEIELNDEDVKALNSLNKTTEKLRQPPRYPIM